MRKYKLTAVFLSLLIGQGGLLYMIKHPKDPDWSKATVNASNKADQSVVLIQVPNVALGSGAVIDSRGYILTCAHVTDHSTTGRVDVFLYKSTIAVQGKVVWINRDKDLALVKVQVQHLLPALALASKDPEIGELVLSIGHPFGVAWTVGYGIVSKFQPDFDPNHQGADFIQHTAMTHPGNSGGPLINLRGELIGVCARTRQVGFMYVPLELNLAISLHTIRDFLNNAEMVIPPSPELSSCSDI